MTCRASDNRLRQATGATRWPLGRSDFTRTTSTPGRGSGGRALRLADERWNGPPDLLHLAEKVEDLGSEQRWAVESELERVIEHLLKLEHSPSREPRRRWMISVNTARGEIQRRLPRAIPVRLAPPSGAVPSGAPQHEPGPLRSRRGRCRPRSARCLPACPRQFAGGRMVALDPATGSAPTPDEARPPDNGIDHAARRTLRCLDHAASRSAKHLQRSGLAASQRVVCSSR